MPPGEAVIVQLPEGRFVSSTLPVLSMQLGWVTAPMDGAAGVNG